MGKSASPGLPEATESGYHPEGTLPKRELRAMKRKRLLAVVVVLVLILTGLAYGLTHANIGALPEPGPLETSMATRARNWLIARAAQTVPQPGVQDSAATLSKGEALYGMACAACHGQDGHNPAPIGHSMYPRVPDLGSRMVQNLSNRELFWIIKNGIRLSGMPGFGRIDTDEEIWQLTYYVRSLGKPAK